MALQAVGLATHIYNNNFRSILLLLAFPLLILGIMWVFFFVLHLNGLSLYGGVPEKSPTLSFAIEAGNQDVLRFGGYVIAAVVIWFFIAWMGHTRMVRAAVGSVPVTRKQMPQLYNLLENLCISRGLSMPKFELIDTPALNAFASGINDKTYTITLTRGLIETLDQDEIEAVIAHELTHIMNRDVRLLIISVIFVGLISFAMEVAWRSLRYGGRVGAVRYRGSGGKKGGAGALVLIAAVILAVGYLIAILLRFALSRHREYLADAGAVELTKNPDGMMRALLRISGKDQIKDMPADFRQMCIENSQNFLGLFATHPPIKKRVEVLSEMTGTPVPRLKVNLNHPPRRPWEKNRPPENFEAEAFKNFNSDAANDSLHPTLRHSQGRTKGPWEKN